MSELLALSFDVAASPSIWLHATKSTDADRVGAGWGFAWYPNEAAAAVIRDPRPVRDNGMSRMLRDWERFRGTVFLCHIRGAAKRPTEQDTHPFVRAYAGRTYSFAHSGQLDSAAARRLGCGEDRTLQPVGRTDSEHAFCWLLAQIRAAGAQRLAELGYLQVHAWLRELNALGTMSVLFSDGQDVIAYADKSGSQPLYFVRRIPPHAETRLEHPALCVDHSHPLDTYRTMVMVSTTALGEEWERVEPGEMLVARRGALHFMSVAPAELASGPQTESSGGSASSASNRSTNSPTNPQTNAVVAPPASASVDVAVPVPASPAVRQGPVELGSPPSSVQLQPSANRDRAPEPTPTPGSRRYAIYHRTAYRYDAPVERSTHTFRLEPSFADGQRVIEHDQKMSVDCDSQRYEDVFGNRARRVSIDTPYDALEIVARSVVEVRPTPPPSSRRRVTIPMVWMPWQRQMMTPFLLPRELPESQLSELSAFAMSFAERQDFDAIETLRDINETIRRDFQYVQGVTNNDTTPFDVYVTRRGVCQDFANLFICLARLLGVAARYRVGYIHTGSNYDNKLQSEASHAWAEVYLPLVGWRGYDPTNGCLAGIDHIAVASGRNYTDATPTSGTLYKGGGNEKLEVEVRVEVLDGDGDQP